MRSVATKTFFALLCVTGLLAGCNGSDDPAAEAAADTTPEAFSFIDQADVPTAAEVTSAAVVITGIDAPSPVSVTGGSYSIDGGTFTAAPGSVDSGSAVRLRHTSAAADSTAASTTLTVGGVSDTFTSTTAASAADTTPDQFSFADQDNVPAGSERTSNAVTVSGIDAPAAVSVAGGSYSVGCTATFVTTAGTIDDNQTVCVRHISSASGSTATSTTLTVGGMSDTFTSTTAAPPGPPAPPGSDTTPGAFNFVDQNDVATSTQITSAPVTITGIDAPADVTVTGGSYSVGCTATFVTTAGTIDDNQTVCVRHTSSAADSTATSTTLTVGGVSDTFTSTTAAPAADTTPDAFNFVNQDDVATSTVITSAAVTITGINTPSPVTVAGGSYSVGCTATFVTTAGTIGNNETVCVRHTSSAADGTATDTTLTVGGVSDTFTSTTAAAVATSRLLPFLAGNGDLRLFDPEAAIATPDTNPRTVDTGLAPPPASDCTADLLVDDCFGKAEAFYSGTVSGSTVSNLHAARLAYINGGAVYRVDLTQSLDSILVLPAQISSLADACRIVRSETTDFLDIDKSWVVVERVGANPGADLLCDTTGDNAVTVIRLNSLDTDPGLDIPLVLTAGNPLHAQTNASGEITGYVSFETRFESRGTGSCPISETETAPCPVSELVRRDTNLANPTPLKTLSQTSGASIERADLTHLFVTTIPDDSGGLTLFRVESNGTLSPVLYFFGSSSGNLIRDGLHDDTYLYFSQDNVLLRILLNSASEIADPAEPLAELDPSLRIDGNWALDTGAEPARPDRIVFEAHDDSYSDASGVFSAAVDGSTYPTATTLQLYPPRVAPDFEAGSSAYLLLAVNGRAYINITHHGFPGEDALKINTDGTGAVIFEGPSDDGSGAYWAGSNRATTFDLVTDFSVPTQYIFLARHGADLVDTVSVFDPATGLEGIEIGKVVSTGDFQAVNISGLGRYALARVEIDRFGNRDNDVYSLDAETASTETTSALVPLAETDGFTDMPLGN